MTLEVGKVDHEIVVRKVLSNDIIFNPRRVLHGNAHIALFVHQIDRSDI